jgi:hypothetical protein
MFGWKRIFGKQAHVDEIQATIAMLRTHKIQCLKAADLISETADKIANIKGNQRFVELLREILEIVQLRSEAAEHFIKLGEGHLELFQETGIKYTDFVHDVEKIEQSFQAALKELESCKVT